MSEICSYQSGFGNEFATEALPGALPTGQNSPQRCAYGLYAEQWSGTAFTAPRAANRRSWLYRIRPAAMHGSFAPVARDPFEQARLERHMSPDQLRWDPLPLPEAATDFIDGLVQITGNGAPDEHAGCGIYLYAANRSMQNRYFYSADGEWLIVPERGALMIETELGRLELEPQEIAVLPRGLRFRVRLLEELARGYLCENFGAHLRLPELGPIGSNGLANPRDFSVPTAWYEDRDGPGELLPSSRDACGVQRSTTRPSTSSPGTATTRPINMTCAASIPWARSPTIIPTPPSSSYCNRRATRRARAISISWCFRRAGW